MSKKSFVPNHGNLLMQKLASLIENELEKQGVCAVYDSDLTRVWPRSMSLRKRKQEIKRFAKKHELAVTFYDVGLCAIFEKDQAPAAPGAQRVLLLEGDGVKRRRKRQ